MSETTRELEPAIWADYFDGIASELEGLVVTVEVMDEQAGDQVDIERLPLQTIGYDHKDKVVEVAVGGRGTRYPVVFRHFIYEPQTISVEESEGVAPSAILVSDASGARTLIRLFEPAVLET